MEGGCVVSLPVFRTLARRLERWRDDSCDALGGCGGLRVPAVSACSIETGKSARYSWKPSRKSTDRLRCVEGKLLESLRALVAIVL